MGRSRASSFLRLVPAAGAAGSGPDLEIHWVVAADLAGLDFSQVPQELAGRIPRLGTAWLRGTCSAAMDTPEGRQALFFGTAEELADRFAGSTFRRQVNSAGTLWVITLET